MTTARMRIGILDLLHDTAPARFRGRIYNTQLRRQFASIMPQTISVWCRELGHDVHYATYFGQCDPEALLPNDLDIVFISAFTKASLLAYALARVFRARGALTVIGGPHAKSFPDDCLRFFDHAVLDCDRELIVSLLRGEYRPGSTLTADGPVRHWPSLEERAPELRASALASRFSAIKIIPMLSSVGCPYTCSFCVDAQSTHSQLPTDQLAADLRYVAEQIPGRNVVIGFHDPNFGVRFDEVMSAFESLPPETRPAYAIQSSLSLLKEQRLRRLRDTGCTYMLPGVESWSDYSEKSGQRQRTGREKLESVLAHFEQLHETIPGFQANFVFGTDADRGREPVELTCEFIRRAPYVWPGISIPTPFGDTQMFDDYLAQGRILPDMPFAFYYKPFLNFIPAHYGPLEYYAFLIEILSSIVSVRGAMTRLGARTSGYVKALHMVQLSGVYNDLRGVREVYRRLKTDRQMLAFHEGRSRMLPEYYRAKLGTQLGKYYPLLSKTDLSPDIGRRSSGSEPVLGARPLAFAPASPT